MSTQLIYICTRAIATRFTLKKNYHYYTGNKSKHNSLGEKDPKLSTSLVRSIRRRQGGSPKTYGFCNRVCHLFLSPYSFSFFLKSVLLCHATFHWRKKKDKRDFIFLSGNGCVIWTDGRKSYDSNRHLYKVQPGVCVFAVDVCLGLCSRTYSIVYSGDKSCSILKKKKKIPTYPRRSILVGGDPGLNIKETHSGKIRISWWARILSPSHAPTKKEKKKRNIERDRTGEKEVIEWSRFWNLSIVRHHAGSERQPVMTSLLWSDRNTSAWNQGRFIFLRNNQHYSFSILDRKTTMTVRR